MKILFAYYIFFIVLITLLFGTEYIVDNFLSDKNPFKRFWRTHIIGESEQK